MKSRSWILTITAIATLTIISGVVQGTLSGRWGPSVDLTRAGEALEQVPTEIGDWRMQSDEPIQEPVAKMLRCTGSVFRTYTHRHTGQTIRMAIIVGPPGPIAVHTPEICYSSREYSQQAQRASVHVRAADGSREGNFWMLTFRTNDLSAAPLRVYYARSDGGKWQSVENPRISSSGANVLYKIQLAASLPAVDVSSDVQSDPCRSFLEAFLACPDPLGLNDSGQAAGDNVPRDSAQAT